MESKDVFITEKGIQYKCNCMCHKPDVMIMHIKACCDNKGLVTIPFKEIQQVKKEGDNFIINLQYEYKFIIDCSNDTERNIINEIAKFIDNVINIYGK